MNNNTFMTSRLATVLLLAVIACVTQGQAQSQETIHGLPKRFTNPSVWQQIVGLEDYQKTEVKLSWLIEERRQPSPTEPDRGGGAIDSNYRQAQFVHGLSDDDPKVLTWLVRSKSVKSVPLRNAIGLALGISGDLTAKSHMIMVMKTDSNPYIRELAARFLHEWQDDEVLHALEDVAARDPFWIRYLSTKPGEEYLVGYPVRDSARGSIKNIREGRKPNDFSKRRQERFKKKMEDYDEFVEAHKDDLERIAKLINTDRPKIIR